jgi:hypothetical protein
MIFGLRRSIRSAAISVLLWAANRFSIMVSNDYASSRVDRHTILRQYLIGMTSVSRSSWALAAVYCSERTPAARPRSTDAAIRSSSA